MRGWSREAREDNRGGEETLSKYLMYMYENIMKSTVLNN
jgi:hypothetical protein